MPRHRALLCSLALAAAAFLASAAAHADISVDATLSPRNASVGEPMQLAITIVGAQQVAAPNVDTGDDFDVRYIGPSTQISIVNGRMDARTQHNYALVPKKEGSFVLGPFVVEYDGKHYQTQKFKVDVTAAGHGAGGASAPVPGKPDRGAETGDTPRGLRLVLSIPRQEIYLHERVPVDLTLYIPPIRVGDVQYPTIAADGLSIEKLPEPSRRQQYFEQKLFTILHFQTSVVPLHAGALTLGPATERLSVGRDSAWPDDPFFARFFGNTFGAQRTLDLTSEAIPLTVLPLPEEGKPPGFSGAVGSFTMDVKASPTTLVAGDPTTVTITVEGTGNLADAEPPALVSSDGFRTYEPHLNKPSAGSTDAGTASKSYEQVLIPNDATVAAVPPVRFSYFDPQARSYRTLESQPIALTVGPPAAAASTEIVTAAGRVARVPAPEQLGRDIVFIKDDTGRLTSRSDGRYPGGLFLLWQPIPVLMLVTAVWYDRRRQRLRGDARYARFTRAGREARRGLVSAEQAATSGDRQGFYDGVSRTMQDYLAAKLGLPPGGIDAEAVRRGGVPGDCADRIATFFTTCERVRFAAGSADGDMHETLALAQEIVKTLERQQRRQPNATALATAGIVTLVGLALRPGIAPATASTPQSPQTSFFHANALYKDGQYAAAAKEYEELLASGVESGNLYFNLGNAYFKAGETGKAILNYERAERLIPSDPDLRANLAYAQSLTDAAPCIPPLWQRLVFPLAQRLPTRQLVWMASAGYTLLIGALIIHRLWLRRPRWLLYLSAMLAAGVLTVASSLAQQLAIDEWQQQAVVVSSGDTPARFEPAASGTVHFVLKQGSRVRILDTRPGWLQVTRCDGRRGWVEKNTLEDL